MPKTDDLLGRGFEFRLRAALDRVQPPGSAPRYLSVTATATLRTALWRATPAVAVGVAGLLLTAYAATGSPNPVIWTQNAASAINSMTHTPETSPTAEPSSPPVEQPIRGASQPSSEQELPEGSSESSSEASDDFHRPESARLGQHLDDH